MNTTPLISATVEACCDCGADIDISKPCELRTRNGAVTAAICEPCSRRLDVAAAVRA
jgi:hypothetical protein